MSEPVWIWLFQISSAKLDVGLLWIRKRWVALSFAGLLLVTGTAQAAVVTVVSSGGFAVAYRALAPEFERTTGNTLVTSWDLRWGTHRTRFRVVFGAVSQSTW